MVLAALYCLPAWWGGSRSRVVVAAGAFAFSIGWYLLVAVLFAKDGIQIITT